MGTPLGSNGSFEILFVTNLATNWDAGTGTMSIFMVLFVNVFYIVFHCFFYGFCMGFSKNWISKNWNSIGIHCWTSINGYQWKSINEYQWISINEFIDGPSMNMVSFFGPHWAPLGLWDPRGPGRQGPGGQHSYLLVSGVSPNGQV